MKAILILVAFVVCSGTAFADPEKSYQAGKQLAGIPKVDDRGLEEKLADKMREAGAKANSAGKSKPADPKK